MQRNNRRLPSSPNRPAQPNAASFSEADDNNKSSFNTQKLSDQVLRASAVESSNRRKLVRQRTTLAQLHLANMKLHGREDDLKLLKSKLVKLDDDSRPELLLVSGVSGTGMYKT